MNFTIAFENNDKVYEESQDNNSEENIKIPPQNTTYNSNTMTSFGEAAK